MYNRVIKEQDISNLRNEILKFVDLASPKVNNFSKKNLRVSYVYVEESFDTIFSMGYGSVKSTMI